MGNRVTQKTNGAADTNDPKNFLTDRKTQRENNTQVQKNKNKDIIEDKNLDQTYLKYIRKISIFKIVMHMYVILCR